MAVTRIQFRRGTRDEWATEDPTLNLGEPGFENDTGRMKVGTGSTPWSDLAYVGDPVAVMTLDEAVAGTVTEARTLSPSVLSQAVTALAAASAGNSNVYMQPIWDGTGTHPLRPGGLPNTTFVIWRQPTAPLVDSTHSRDGDEWEVTEA